MKVFIVYSGKGGVGKTTTSTNIAKLLVSLGYKVFVVDADVNTPSVPVIFPETDFSDKLQCASMGYTAKNSIYLTDSAVRSYITESINAINKFKPDFVLIDTPPSITDIHINLLDKVKPSGLLIVTQPNTLSMTDVNRTAMFFKERNVPILGIIENMCPVGSEPNKYPWKLLASIPFSDDFNYNTVYANNKDKYQLIVDGIINSDSVILENKKREIFDESITVDDVATLPARSQSDIKFINLATWDYVSDILINMIQGSGLGIVDRMLTYNSTEKIGRVLKAFETDDEAYMMVINSPSTVIKLITGEIGKCTLFVANSHYGIPRVKYQTSQGELVLFPHEIMPVDNKELILSLEDGYIATKDGRYMPPKHIVEQCHAMYGSSVGLMADWEQTYDAIMEGKMPMINDQQHLHEAATKKTKEKRTRGVSGGQNVGDFAYLHTGSRLTYRGHRK